MDDLQEIQHLDFVPQLTCERRPNRVAVRCGQPAVWVVRCTCCKEISVVCGRCRLYLEVLPVVGPHWCGMVGDPQRVLTFERLVAE